MATAETNNLAAHIQPSNMASGRWKTTAHKSCAAEPYEQEPNVFKGTRPLRLIHPACIEIPYHVLRSWGEKRFSTSDWLYQRWDLSLLSFDKEYWRARRSQMTKVRRSIKFDGKEWLEG
ncbi:hypothetical protein PV11_06021 [Exophiala sideris]|uniref:Uncharacterized protein n=1 Tax=Exophiala sideris TaxID=1016849 RepID=A0A0D1X8C4_9EURO|nr:hypothetical protein PV11_06021 [Exophiala sideris]